MDRKQDAGITMGTFAEAFDDMPTTLGEPRKPARKTKVPTPQASPAPVVAAAPVRTPARKTETRITGPAPETGKKVAISGEAVIVFRGGKLTLHDLGAADGVFVNGEPAKARGLEEGDYIQLGDLEVYLCESLAKAKAAHKDRQRNGRKVEAVPAQADEEIDPEFLTSDEEPAPKHEAIDPSFLVSDEDESGDEQPEAAAASIALEEVNLDDEDDDEIESAAAGDEAEASAETSDEDTPAGAAEIEETDETGDDEESGEEFAADEEAAPAPRSGSNRRVFALAAALTAAILLCLVGFVFAGRSDEAMPTFDEMLEPALAGLEQGNFDGAVDEFTRLSELFPESEVPAAGLEIAKLFRTNTDPFLFDWGKADGLYRDLAKLDEATQALQAFAQKQSEWVQREKACAELIYQAQEHVEKKDLENALALYEQIEKEFENSDLRMAVKADLVKIRVSLRKDYVAKAEKSLEGKAPDWTAAIASYEKAVKFYAQPDPEIADAIEACRKNFDVKVKLASCDQLARNGRLDDALDALDKIAMGSHYDRALLTLKTNIANEKQFQKAVKAYRQKDARTALDLLATHPEERAAALTQKIKTVVAGLEEGKRLYQVHEYVDALPHLEAVRKAESDNANPYLQEAAQIHKASRSKVREVAEESFAKGMQAFDEARYGTAIEQFKRLAKYDTDGSLTDKIRRRVELESGKLMKEVKGHFWTSTPTDSDQVVLDLLIRYLAQENTVRQEALKFKNNLEEAKMKESAKASAMPKR